MDAREDVIVSLQIAVGIGIELPLKHLRVGLVTDAEEQGAGRKVPYFACLQVAQLQSGHFVLVDVVNIVHHGVEQELDLLMLLRALQHDFGSAKSIAPMNHCHLACKASEEQRLFHGGIPAADHNNFLTGEKETITSRARRHAVPDQLLLVRQTQPARRCAAGNDQSLRVHHMMSDV